MNGSTTSAVSSVPVGRGKIIRNAMMNNRMPPDRLSVGCVSPTNFITGLPTNRNISRIANAMVSSRAMIRDRVRASKRASTALKTGMLPSGSMTKNSVTATARMSG